MGIFKMTENLVCDRVLENCQITHPTKQVYNIWLADYLCDVLLDVNGCLFASARKVLISACANFKSMFDESSGWVETSKNLEKHQGIPIVKLQVDFSPKAFNVWHQSLFTNQLQLTVDNDAKILSKIEAFMKSQMNKLNPFEELDLSRNLN